MRYSLWASVFLILFSSACSFPFGNSGQQPLRPHIVEARLPLRVGLSSKSAVFVAPETHEYPRKFSPLLISNTPEVNSFVDHYLTDNRLYLEESLQRREQYRSVMESVFANYELPVELINLALIESGFNPDARSPQGAVGLWQFVKATARVYGLKINAKVDERRDVFKSTIAAAKHLVDLYSTFGDWYLVLAAYNAGPGSINRAISRGGSRNFFELGSQNLLAQETKDFVPRFLAITKICRNAPAFGLSSRVDLAWVKSQNSKIRH